MARDVELLEHQVDFYRYLELSHATLAQLADQLRAMATNHVLFSGLVVLDGAGLWSRSWAVPFASMAVHHYGQGTLTVTAAEPQASAPTQGEGVHLVGTRATEVINAAAHVLTIYGNAGDMVNLQVFDRAQPPMGVSVAPVTATSAGPVAVAQNAASVVLAAANTSRKGGLIFNNTAANLYVTFAAASAVALFTQKIAPGQSFDIGGQPVYRGVISGIWDAAGAGNAMVTELV